MYGQEVGGCLVVGVSVGVSVSCFDSTYTAQKSSKSSPVFTIENK